MDEYRKKFSQFLLTLTLVSLLQGQAVHAELIEELLEDRAYQPRFGVHHEMASYGVRDSWTDFRAFVHFDLTDSDEDMFAFDGRLRSDAFSNYGYSYGLLGRSYHDGLDAVFGLNMYYDQRDTGLNTYNQLGWGWEILHDKYEVRQNFYHPVGTDRNQVGTGINAGGLIGFQANNLMYGEDRFFEQALRGFDFEVGGDVPGTRDVIEGLRPARAYIGTYYYDNPDGG
ncbi:MAG: inverse autotransporter beta domain-containing protein [Planctomycetaceae bacterium]|nr:inverse autotransporter beta domain-containing protein [bacterium]MDB4679564.1 inverse autotransporter beta domain-containing protein [Planctomycetaceae bacterium]MDG2390576.1 inverse autotransporter beta domain-containing protein [Planctomycetaceae bacterium]